jgi:NAD(P)-dependent dehydrogenase (short-subunit alcohol dehydrogenase family)
VTGSNRGVGRGFVEVLLARGARRVYATARQPDLLAEIVALDPKRVVPLELDVTNDAHRRAAAEKARDVTWLINNAAYPGSASAAERRFLAASSLDDAHKVMDTNCWSPAELARRFVPIILQNGGGALVNILSIGALFTVPEFSSYSMSKAAHARVTAGFRAELDREPILVAAVYTGGVMTRAAPVGSKGVTPVEHASEVIDALGAGETDIWAAGSAAMRDRIAADPKGFERGNIERFYNNPIRISEY